MPTEMNLTVAASEIRKFKKLFDGVERIEDIIHTASLAEKRLNAVTAQIEPLQKQTAELIVERDGVKEEISKLRAKHKSETVKLSGRFNEKNAELQRSFRADQTALSAQIRDMKAELKTLRETKAREEAAYAADMEAATAELASARRGLERLKKSIEGVPA